MADALVCVFLHPTLSPCLSTLRVCVCVCVGILQRPLRLFCCHHKGRSFGDILPAMQEQLRFVPRARICPHFENARAPACLDRTTLLRDLIPHVQVNPRPDVMVLAKGEAVSLGSEQGAIPISYVYPPFYPSRFPRLPSRYRRPPQSEAAYSWGSDGT